jgi:hypothetical protein
MKIVPSCLLFVVWHHVLWRLLADRKPRCPQYHLTLWIIINSDAVSQIHDYGMVEHYPIECIPVFNFSAEPLRVAAKALKNDTRVWWIDTCWDNIRSQVRNNDVNPDLRLIHWTDQNDTMDSHEPCFRLQNKQKCWNCAHNYPDDTLIAWVDLQSLSESSSRLSLKMTRSCWRTRIWIARSQTLLLAWSSRSTRAKRSSP